MLVVLHHLASSQLEFLPRWGEFGVAIFFVISGFIMWDTTAARNASVVEFWRRRIIRIVPLYWLCLSALVIVALLAPRLLNTTVITTEAVIKSFLFLPHFHAVQQQLIAPLIIPGWSLNFEMFFYLLFGFSLFVRSKLRRSILLGVLLLSLVVLGFAFQPTGAITSTYTSPKLLTFFDGIALAMIFRSRWAISGLTFGLILISIGLFSKFIPDSNYLGALVSYIGLPPTLIVAGALALEFAARSAPSVALHAIGNASYSVYLSHLFVLRIVELAWKRLFFGSNGFLDVTYALLAFASAIGGGIALHYFIERPMLAFFQKRSFLKIKQAHTDSVADGRSPDISEA